MLGATRVASNLVGTGIALFVATQPHVALAQADPDEVATPATDEVSDGQPEQPSANPESDGTEESAPLGTDESADSEEAAPSGVAEDPAHSGDAPTSPSLEDFRALQERVVELEAAQEEAEIATLTSQEAASIDEPSFRIYGFMDMGIQRTWVKEGTIIDAFFDSNALTFATGNVDLYFDFMPVPDWRALTEVRFTNAPRGQVNNYGGLAGTFEREDTEQFDPHGSVFNAPMWRGALVLERAWVEWGRYQSFRVRTGNFFTPFGIWNVDHGTPTLISLGLPQFILQKFIPLRQTGVQALGSFFAKDWEFAYRAWVTNGREEQNPLDFTDDKAVGARTFLRKHASGVQTVIGASFHHGRVGNKVIDVVGIPPTTDRLEFEVRETVAYYENIIGLDFSLDWGRTRVRAEGIAQQRLFEEGKRDTFDISSPVQNAQTPDDWRVGAYGLFGHELPWWGLEPYIFAEVTRQTFTLPDGLVSIAPGLNIRMNSAVQLKSQVIHAWLFNWQEDVPGDPSDHTTTAITSRLVVAF